jgi:hypothetical protein
MVTSLVLLLIAPAAMASTRINKMVEPGFPPLFANYQYLVSVDGSSGANHDIVVKPSGAQQLGGFPQRVDVYDYGDSFDAGNSNCKVFSAHHAACIVSGPPRNPSDSYSYTSLAEIGVSTGDGNDTVTISDPLNPMIAEAGTGAGDDHVEISGMWELQGPYFAQDSLGDGNDYEKVGPASQFPIPFAVGAESFPLLGREVWAGAGDDTIDSLNGTVDSIHCEDGNDTWQADPSDDQKSSHAGYGPPDTNGDCETRTPPVAVDTSSLP